MRTTTADFARIEQQFELLLRVIDTWERASWCLDRLERLEGTATEYETLATCATELSNQYLEEYARDQN